MFEQWHEYYLLVGGAAGALIGLLFVVATLTVNFPADRSHRGVAFFMTPTLYDLGVVLALSAMAMAPGMEGALAAWLVAVAAAGGAAFAFYAIYGIAVQNRAEHWSDVWTYGVIPLALYGGLVGVAVVLHGGQGAPLLAAMMMAVLAIAIRNAWDLVTWMSARATPERRG